eukprot:g14218.t1 g14218   contig9:1413419-1414612(+)
MKLTAFSLLLTAASATRPHFSSIATAGRSTRFLPSVAFVNSSSLSNIVSVGVSSTTTRTPSSSSSSTNTRRNMSSSTDKQTLISCPTLSLRDGTSHPAIGFGTYKVGFIPASASAAVEGTTTDEQLRTAAECVRDALDVGYRFLECAEFYGNEAEVGKAIKESGVKREELFLCSKVWTTTIEKGDAAVRERLEKTLADLGTDYIDLYLIHWPVPGKHVDAYKTLEQLQKEGKIRNIGVSNYAVEDFKELLDAGITSKPAVNQIEINPFLYRKNTINYFESEGVVMQSYRSLRDGKAMDHPTLKKIGESHGKSPAQVLGRWCVQHGFVYMPKSVKVERMKENAQVFDFELSEKEMEQLDGLTTPEAFAAFEALYRKCVNRDTSKDGTMDGVKMDITID